MNTQLDLFHGIVLTQDQQENVNRYIERCKRDTEKKHNDYLQIIQLLNDAGFKKGVDFDTNFSIEKRTYDKKFGYSYDNSEYTYEVTTEDIVGGVYLIVNKINNYEIEKGRASVSREGDKLLCSSITDQYRYLKPETLLNKLNVYNERTVSKLENIKKKDNILDYTIEKYKKLYPEAVVESGRDYYKRTQYQYEEFAVVNITFKSGSSVTLKPGIEKDREMLHRKYDAQELRGLEVLDYFNNQK